MIPIPLSARQVARLLGVSHQTVRNRQKAGSLPQEISLGWLIRRDPSLRGAQLASALNAAPKLYTQADLDAACDAARAAAAGDLARALMQHANTSTPAQETR